MEEWKEKIMKVNSFIKCIENPSTQVGVRGCRGLFGPTLYKEFLSDPDPIIVFLFASSHGILETNYSMLVPVPKVSKSLDPSPIHSSLAAPLV